MARLHRLRLRWPVAILASGWVAIFVLFPREASAQGAGSATLRGTVTDASGAVLPGATVTVVSQRTTLARTATSDGRGEYVVTALTPGPYKARVDLAGFSRWQSDEFHVSPGDSLHLAATLAVGQRSETIMVEAERDLLRTDSGAREGVITSDQIQNLSIISRGALELLRILPGTVSDQPSMEAVGFNAGGANNLYLYNVNGQRGTQLNLVLDGTEILDFGSNGSVMANINPDMVDEVKVQTSNYAAEFGSASVQITAVTKGGSAAFHGSLYDYWRNWRFAANDRSNNFADVPRPKSNYNYPGFNLAGPLLVPGTGFNRNRDKLFFFVGFEAQRQVLDVGTSLGTVPTVAQREGDFSELLAGRGQNLGQPTVVTIPAGFPGAGEPAPGNDLRPYVDTYGRVFLGLYPLPNHTDPDNLYNYTFSTPRPLNRWQLVSRIDWNVSEATHAYVRLALEKETDEWARGVWDCCSGYELPSDVVGDNRSWSVSANVTSELGPSLTNELVVSASQLKLDNDWKDPARVSLSALGIPGYRGVFETGSDEVPLAFASWGLALGELNTGGGLPVYARSDGLSFADSLTKVKGTHRIKLGAFVERGQRQQNFTSNLQGAFVLGSTWMGGGTANDYGDLLVGRMAQFYQETNVPRGDWRFWNYEAYVQDAWKVLPNLTLELGLRIAKMPNNEELKDLGLRLEPSAYDPSQGTFIDGDSQRPNGVLLASRGEIPRGMTENPGLKAMPRLLVAWDVRGDGGWILRGGAGSFYNRPAGNHQYEVQNVAPNRLNTIVYWDQPEGGLTIASLPTIDSFSRLGSTWLHSPDAHSIHLPRTLTWSLGVDKRLPWQQTLEVAYVGNRQDFLPSLTPSSYIIPGSLTGSVGNADLDNPLHRVALDESVAATFRVFPAYNLASWWGQYEAVGRYHALQATLMRSAGRHVQYFVNYTFSKVLGTTGTQDDSVIDPIDPRGRSYGIPIWDRTHIFNASYNVLLPDPIRPDGNAFLRGALNGWQVSGITRYGSGMPFRVVFSGDIVQPEVQRAWWGTDAHAGVESWGGGSASGVTPILLGNPQFDNTRVGEKILDIDKIGIPAFGESGPLQSPYYLRAPSRWNFDMSVFKNFALGARKLQLRLGFFNLFNQAAPIYWAGDIDLNLQTECNVRVDGVPNGAGGSVDGVCDPTQGFHFTDLTTQNFGKIVSKHGHRVIELAARFEF